MNRFFRVACLGSLLLLTGCASLRSLDVDWVNRLLNTPTPVPISTLVPSPQPTLATPSVTEEPNPSVTESTSLRIWLPPQFNPNGNTTASALLKQRLASFAAEHPGLELDVRIKSESGEADLLNSLSITSMAAPAALPDLIALPRSALESAAQKRLLKPLDALTTDVDMYPYARELGKVEGTTYGIPFAGDALVILYRPELVWIKNWDSILLSESRLVFAGADTQSQIGLALYVSAGGELQDAQGKPVLDQEVLSRVLDLFAKGRDITLFPDAVANLVTEDQVMQEYRSRRAEMSIVHYSQFRSTQDGLLQPLMGLDVDHLTFASGWMWAIPTQTGGNQQLIHELIAYLTADEFTQQWITESGYLPTRPTELSNTDTEPVTQVIQAAQLVPSNDVLLTLGPLMQESLTRVLNGEQADAVARSIVEKLK